MSAQIIGRVSCRDLLSNLILSIHLLWHLYGAGRVPATDNSLYLFIFWIYLFFENILAACHDGSFFLVAASLVFYFILFPWVRLIVASN